MVPPIENMPDFDAEVREYARRWFMENLEEIQVADTPFYLVSPAMLQTERFKNALVTMEYNIGGRKVLLVSA